MGAQGVTSGRTGDVHARADVVTVLRRAYAALERLPGQAAHANPAIPKRKSVVVVSNVARDVLWELEALKTLQCGDLRGMPRVSGALVERSERVHLEKQFLHSRVLSTARREREGKNRRSRTRRARGAQHRAAPFPPNRTRRASRDAAALTRRDAPAATSSPYPEIAPVAKAVQQRAAVVPCLNLVLPELDVRQSLLRRVRVCAVCWDPSAPHVFAHPVSKTCVQRAPTLRSSSAACYRFPAPS